MSSNLNFIQHTEPMAGAGGGYSDTLNRALRNMLSLSGYNPDATTFTGLHGPVMNVVAFGADNAGNIDATAAFAAAFSALPAKGGVVFVPDGIYKASTINPPGRINYQDSSHIKLHLATNAVIRLNSSTSGAVLLDLNNEVQADGLFELEGGVLDGGFATGGALTAATGVRVRHGNVRIRNTTIQRFGSFGVNYDSGNAPYVPIVCSLYGCHIVYNGVGVRGDQSSGLQVTACRVEGNNAEGFLLDNAGQFSLLGNVVENNGLVTTTAPQIRIKNGTDGSILGCYFESSAYQQHAQIIVEGVSLSPQAITISANRFVGYYETSNGSGVAATGNIAIDIGAGGAGAVDSVIARGNYYAGMYMGVRIGVNARGCIIGPDAFSTNFDPAFVTPACVRYSNLSSWANSVRDTNKYASAIYETGVYQALMTTTLAASGVVSLSDALKFVANGTSVDGSISRSAAQGLNIRAIAGSAQDMLMTGPGGVGYVKWDTGSIDANFFGNVKAGVVGKGVYVKEGANATMGVATLVAGSVVVSTTKVTASSRIMLTGQNASGTAGELTISARTAGTSFTITSSSGADTRNIGWVILEPA